MGLETLEELLARFLGEPRAGQPAVDAGDVAELAAALHLKDGPGPAPAGDPDERLAAHLDGALEGNDRSAFEAWLAQAPGAWEDVESAGLFVEAVTNEMTAAPADILETALAAFQEKPRPVRAQGLATRKAGRFWRPRSYGVIGGLAAVALAVLLFVPSIMNEGLEKDSGGAAPTMGRGSVGASHMPDEMAAGGIAHLGAVRPGLSRDASSVASGTPKALQLPGGSEEQEKLAAKGKTASGSNIADYDCATSSADNNDPGGKHRAGSGKASGASLASEDCGDIMVGGVYPGGDGQAVTAASPLPDTVGNGEVLPPLPAGPDGN